VNERSRRSIIVGARAPIEKTLAIGADYRADITVEAIRKAMAAAGRR